MLHISRCCESLLEKIEDKRRTGSILRTTLPRYPGSAYVCARAYCADVHKVYLVEYTGTRDDGARI